MGDCAASQYCRSAWLFGGAAFDCALTVFHVDTSAKTWVLYRYSTSGSHALWGPCRCSSVDSSIQIFKPFLLLINITVSSIEELEVR